MLSSESAPAGKNPTAVITGSRALALVPLLVTLLFAALMLPRSVPPRDVPLPAIDARAIAAVEANDRALALRARDGLSDNSRVLGSALRAYQELQTSEGSEAEIVRSRGDLNRAVAAVLETAPHEIKLLRAAQLEIFLGAVSEFERTGIEPDDLRQVGGTFVRRMRDVGWVVGSKVLPDPTVRAVLFKLSWNGTLSLVNDASLDPSLDEMRAVYSFYLRYPHVAENRKPMLDAAKGGARNKAACEETAALEAGAIEDWRLDKVRRLGAIDPTYPTAFAVGVVRYRQGRYSASAEAFRDWLSEHPEGALGLRAQNHLRAAVRADSM